MYYKITAVYYENDIKHIKTLFQRHAILYMLNQDAHIFLFFSLKHIGMNMCTHPHSHTYTYYVVTTGLSTVHISHKY
jgi:hypothetical protein